MKIICFFILMSSFATAKTPFSSSRLDKLSGERKAKFDTKSDWDQKYSRSSFVYGKSPAKFLAENFDYLKADSNILDMGMGEGRNAVFLAGKGHKVTGIDISSVAIKKAYHLAREFGVKIKGLVASLEKYNIADESYDAIICFYYVDRSLIPKIKKWLKPGGIIIYEAYTLKEREKKEHRKDPISYYLKEQELISLFDGFKLLKYEEPHNESKNRASVILMKPNRKSKPKSNKE
jgi:tellurite methyltransferase